MHSQSSYSPRSGNHYFCMFYILHDSLSFTLTAQPQLTKHLMTTFFSQKTTRFQKHDKPCKFRIKNTHYLLSFECINRAFSTVLPK